MKVRDFILLVDKTKDFTLIEEHNSSACKIYSYEEYFNEEVQKILDLKVTQISYNDENHEFIVTYRSIHTEAFYKHLLNQQYGKYIDTDSTSEVKTIESNTEKN